MSTAHKKHIKVSAALIFREGKVLITRRPEGSHLAGLWEFPGGKQEAGETPEECLRREIKEELDIDIAIGRLVQEVRHEYDSKIVTLFFFNSICMKGIPRAIENQEIKWVDPVDLERYSFPPPDRKIIDYLIGKQAS